MESKSIKSPKRSPFLVDLVAENERIDEEFQVRKKLQIRKQKILAKAREEDKNNIILRALQEGNEIEVLRREKRSILEEEKRLKAMIEIEKLNAQRKDDRIRAERAERKRKRNKATKRQTKNKCMIDEHARVEQDILRVKHKIEIRPNNSFSTIFYTQKYRNSKSTVYRTALVPNSTFSLVRCQISFFWSS